MYSVAVLISKFIVEKRMNGTFYLTFELGWPCSPT